MTMTTTPSDASDVEPVATSDPAEIEMASIAGAACEAAQLMTHFGTRPAGIPPLGGVSVWHRPLLGRPQVDIRINGTGRVEDMRRWLELLPPETEVVVCRSDADRPFVRLWAYTLCGSTCIRLVNHLYAEDELAKLWKVMDIPEIGEELQVSRDVLDAAVEDDSPEDSEIPEAPEAPGDAQDGEPSAGQDDEAGEEAEQDLAVEVSP